MGDDAFTFDIHMIPQHEAEVLFNYRLSRAQRVVENAFGILSARFRLLRRTIVGSETLVCSSILAATALHNLHLSRADGVNPKVKANLTRGYENVYKTTDYFLKKGNREMGASWMRLVFTENLLQRSKVTGSAAQPLQLGRSEVTGSVAQPLQLGRSWYRYF